MTKLLPFILLVCLAARLAPAASNPSGIVVTGIVDLPGYKCALLERSDSNSPSRAAQTLTLQEGQSEDGIEVLQIDAQARVVKVKQRAADPTVTLDLGTQTNSPSITPLTLPLTIQLRHATLNQTLILYGQLANRTVLRPTLTVGPVSLSSSATNQAEAALALSKALNELGLATVMDGEKFVLVVPADKLSMAAPHSAEVKSQPLELEPAKPAAGSSMMPAGEINFPAVDVAMAALIYAELRGTQLDLSERFPSNGRISLHTQTPLTKEEAIYALETLLRWQDIKMVPAGKALLKAVRISGK